MSTEQPAADATEAMVTVKTLKYHTHQGVEHQEGDTYSVPESQVDNLVVQGMVSREPVH